MDHRQAVAPNPIGTLCDWLIGDAGRRFVVARFRENRGACWVAPPCPSTERELERWLRDGVTHPGHPYPRYFPIVWGGHCSAVAVLHRGHTGVLYDPHAGALPDGQTRWRVVPPFEILRRVLPRLERVALSVANQRHRGDVFDSDRRLHKRARLN